MFHICIKEMYVHEYLSALDWPKYTVLYSLGFRKENLDDTISREKKCEGDVRQVNTRCLLNAYLAQFILNRDDIWKRVSTRYAIANLGRIAAMSIEVDIAGTYIDHMFTLVNLGSGWYIIQSYINRYKCIIEPIDVAKFMNTIHRWEISGVNPSEWEKYFHVQINATGEATPHIYYTDRIDISNINDAVPLIEDRIRELVSDRGSYIYDQKYRCILSQWS